MKNALRLLFITLFAVISGYIVFVETERYESNSIILLKDLSEKQKMDFSSMFLGQSSSTTQDSKVLELYIRSNEMFQFIDARFHLSSYYVSEKLDMFQKLYADTALPMYFASKKNILEKYNQDLNVIYDEPSGTLLLSFIHVDANISQQILEVITKHSDTIINHFTQENAEVALNFIKKQLKENRVHFIDSIKKLIAYQNKHNTIDPNLDIERKSTILANLEGDLIKNEVEYNSKLKSWNPNGKEMKMLKEVTANLKRSISRVKTYLASTGSEFNSNVFDFELLKSDMEFNKEIYRQTLINQEELKMEVRQNSKHLVVVSEPTLADYYAYPNKLWDVFTMFILLFFIYSIVTTVLMLIRDHKD